jgi:hypothetical protein
VSPTVFRYKNYRFFFFSKEEPRMHIHVYGNNSEAKFWLEPKVELVYGYNLNSKEIKTLEQLIKERLYEIKEKWQKYFCS